MPTLHNPTLATMPYERRMAIAETARKHGVWLIEDDLYGGMAEDAFDLVIPALPGYGFSDAPGETGWDPDRVGRAWAELMERLGYERYGAQGGDWGSAISRGVARHGGERVIGIHLNHDYVDGAKIERLGVEDDFERWTVERRAEFNRTGRGYSRQQATRPQTLGFGLADSPAGQCAWILEKFHFWSDPETIYGRDALLDNVTLYWLTNTAVSSARLYWESKLAFFAPKGVELPTGVSVFPDEIYAAPRSWATRAYPNLVHFNRLERGGHFAAWEQPELFSQEVRATFRSLR